MPELHALFGKAGAAAVIIAVTAVVVCGGVYAASGAVALIWRLL